MLYVYNCITEFSSLYPLFDIDIADFFFLIMQFKIQ